MVVINSGATQTSSSPDVADTRINIHRDRLAGAIPSRYEPRLYFGAANVVALTAIMVALWPLHAVSSLELLTVPLAFLTANWVEYLVHRGPMHHLRHGREILFERHTRQHHVYFDHEHMAARTPREYYWVFFPWWAIGLVIVTAALLALPLWWFVSENVARLFFAVGITYYLTYEWLHFSYHVPHNSPIGRLRLVRALRGLHTAHHDPARMTECNFNITFPICDLLYRTKSTPPSHHSDH